MRTVSFFVVLMSLLGALWARADEPPAFSAVAGAIEAVLADDFSTAERELRGVTLAAREGGIQAQAATVAAERAREALGDTRLARRERYDAALDLLGEAARLLARDAADLSRYGREPGAAIRLLRVAERLAYGGRAAAATSLLADARALVARCPAEPALTEAAREIETATAERGSLAATRAARERAEPLLRRSSRHSGATEELRGATWGELPASPATPVGRVSCTSADKHHEEHRGGHAGEGDGERAAREASQRECHRFHTSCHVRECRRTG